MVYFLARPPDFEYVGSLVLTWQNLVKCLHFPRLKKSGSVSFLPFCQIYLKKKNTVLSLLSLSKLNEIHHHCLEIGAKTMLFLPFSLTTAAIFSTDSLAFLLERTLDSSNVDSLIIIRCCSHCKDDISKFVVKEKCILY